MKKNFSTALLFFLVCLPLTALAEDPKNHGQEIINLPMGNLRLPFKHWKHQKSLKNECYHCHASKDGKIDKWSKETAHTLCIPCHDLYDNGPVECKQCHDLKSKK